MKLYNIFLEKTLFPLSDFILGIVYWKTLQEYRKVQFSTKFELQELQKSRLLTVLNYSKKSIPFYKSKDISNEPDPEKLLKAFPILTKENLRDEIDELCALSKKNLVAEKSSGSSGVQTTVYMTKEEHSIPPAVQTLLWEWGGYKFGKSIVQTGMTLNRGFVKRVKDILLRTEYVSAFNLNEETVLQQLKKWQKKPRSHFMGYASSIFVYANIAKKYGIDNVYFDSVISYGDKMFPHYRKMIEEQFNTKVFDTYGSTEGVVIAGQCEYGTYHVMTPHVFLELVDENGNYVPEGEMGYVVVTRLDGYSMPLIRYYLGDLAIGSLSSKCRCGRHLSQLKQIIGRDTDIVKTPNGGNLIVHFFTAIFEHIPEIRQFQIVQKKLNGIDILYIPSEGFQMMILANVQKRILEKIKSNFDINFIEVNQILASKSGKPQIIKSYLPKGLKNE